LKAGVGNLLGSGIAHCNPETKMYQNGVKVTGLCMDSIIVNGYGQFRNYLNYSEIYGAIGQTYVIPKVGISHSYRFTNQTPSQKRLLTL
jgi:hypothetical protein